MTTSKFGTSNNPNTINLKPISNMNLWLNNFIRQEKLPESFQQVAQTYYLPLVHQIKKSRLNISLADSKTYVVGINGAQGTGKSTLAAFLSGLLELEGLKTAVISIDDLYHTKAKREQMAGQIHPLLKTRGVPGTHDVNLGIQVLKTLSGQLPSDGIQMPRFDKSIDDRSQSLESLPLCPVDVVLLEGWCVGAKPLPEDELNSPINELEKVEDDQCVWRQYINQALKENYPRLFDMIDLLIMLKAPDLSSIYEWRSEQEAKMKARIAQIEGEDAVCSHPGIMNSAQLKRFIMHYERLTNWILEEMPSRADIVLHLTPTHTISKVTRPNVPRLLVVTDLDATLLDDQYQWEPARESLSELIARDCPVILNSSKTLAEMTTLASELAKTLKMPYWPIIAENGGVVAIASKTEPDQSEPEYSIEYPGISRNDILTTVHKLRESDSYQFKGFDDMTAHQVAELTGLTLHAAKLARSRHATEPILWEDTQARWIAFESTIANHGIRALRGGRFIHLMGEVDKADGLWHVLKMFQESDKAAGRPDHWLTVALGDSPNDLAMLNSADIAVAIHNPHQDVRLDVTTPHVIRPVATGPSGWHEGMSQILGQIFQDRT